MCLKAKDNNITFSNKLLGPRKRKVQKKLNFIANFAWNPAYSDKSSSEYLGIKSTMLTFVTALFQNIMDQHG